MADSVLNLLLNIRKGGKGDKEAASGIDAMGKKLDGVLKNAKQNSQMLTHTVGAVGKLLGDAFKLAADEAERLGRSEVTAQMKEMDAAFKTVTDTLVQIPIGGRDFLAWMGDAAEGAANAGKAIAALSIYIAKNTGAMTENEASLQATLLMQGPVVLSTEQLTQAQKDMADPLDESNRLLREQATAEEAAQAMADIATKKAYDYKLAMEALTGPVSDLNFAMGELTTATLFNQAAQGLDAEASLRLAIGMGLVDEKSLAAKNKLDELRVAFDADKDGKISATEAANGYTEAVIRMNQELDGSLERLRSITAEMNSMPGGISGKHGGAIEDNGDFATGGSFMVGGTGGTDSQRVMFNATPGERVTIETPAQQAASNSSALNFGGVTINVSGAGNPDAVAEAVMLKIARLTRSAKNSGAAMVGAQ